jgi:cysteinyl-tRNA synthetase
MIDINNCDNYSYSITIYNSKTLKGLGKILVCPDGHTFMAASTVQDYTEQDLESIVKILKVFNSVKQNTEPTNIGVNTYSNAITLLKERDKLRANKQFEEADVIRTQIETMGFLIIDTSTGSKLEHNLNHK